MRDFTPIERACFHYVGAVIVERDGTRYEVRRLWNERIRVRVVR